MQTADVIVIGGGNIGSVVAYGLAKLGVAVTMLDEGDMAFRAARGNFGLVWFQRKGLGMQRYVEWCLEATQQWPALAVELEDKTGISIGYQKPGGMTLCHDEADYATTTRLVNDLRRQSDNGIYDCEVIDRHEIQSLIPRMTLGPAILGGTLLHDGCLF